MSAERIPSCPRCAPSLCSPEDQAKYFEEAPAAATPAMSKIARCDAQGGDVKASRFLQVNEFEKMLGFMRPRVTTGEGDKYKKSPKVIVITRSANRACDIIRSISQLRVRTLKLFSRHMKPSEQEQLLKSGGYPIGVGTPNRILKLAQLKSLNFSKTKLVVFDLSPLSSEMNFNVLNMKGGVSGDTFKLFREHIARSNAQLALW